MATTKVYGLALKSAWDKLIDFDTDVLKWMLTTSTYAPNLDTHQFKSSVTNEIAGTGYAAGGLTATGASLTYTAANSWAVSRANSTAYAQGDIVRPATGNGFLYRATVAGTSGGSIPTYPTVVGQTVVDGGVTWTNIGTGVLVLDAVDPAWTSATFSGVRYMILYDSTPATDATRPLIALVDFVTDQAVTSGTFTGVLAATGIAVFANG